MAEQGGRPDSINNALLCVACGATSQIRCLDTKVTLDNLIRRRRHCTRCGHDWMTLEREERSIERTVQKGDTLALRQAMLLLRHLRDEPWPSPAL